ncbi:transmembrane amino acid transporter protein-domain-containing protein [Halteromyces radiatus]|uniref:transmembrane amino acid transporter protein-domain-containing protein n=1 Tax=Halteromyces radiatus TaxID=101107 RepID=UPI00221F8674|nr:transmembrane amino acid transporter protein-domain-containing protein [Halteromyces radiatus]KAI8096706.1 transmembrane amino acid transporter protein-domain-containing protein [Halteromyces radiatus]
MNIPNSVERGEMQTIPNLHPSQRSPSRATDTTTIAANGLYYDNATSPTDTPLSESFSDRLGSFVGSFSRTSLMYMAENVTVSNPSDSLMDTNDDQVSIISSYNPRSRRNSLGTLHDERTSLLGYQPIDKVYTGQSHISTIADTYQDDTSTHNIHHKKSNFLQSVFNSINILAGVGILALPLGFKYAGWILGFVLFFFCLGLTNYTAKLLGRCLYAYPESQTYGDMAYNAFGNRGRILVSILFLTELVTCAVALVVLLSDGLDSLFFPGEHPLSMRVASFFILTPMLFFPVRHLSYTSLIGIMSALSIIIVLVADGFTKTTSPGSLIEPADTTYWPEDWMALPRSTGIIMSGCAGHACLATIYRDMQKPKQYTRMVDWTYIITALIYLTVAVTGYRMFGSKTMQEITQNLVLIPEYNQMFNRMAVWLIALNPIAKYGLTLNPVNLSWELALARQPSVYIWCNKQPWRGKVISLVGKVTVSALVVLLAYAIPEFDRIMSLLGACFSFIVSGLFPILCYLKLFGHTLSSWEKLILYILFFLCFVLALVGTIWSFI